MSTLWQGRYEGAVDPRLRRLNDSLPFDRRLFRADVFASQAWVRGLVRAGVLTPEEGESLIEGLERVREEFESGAFRPAPGDEDIHTAVERRLGELVGRELAGKLHTGRSRNDQVATDFRLFVLAAQARIARAVREVQGALFHQARRHRDLLWPGYTHLRPAQPVRYAHWCLSHFWPLQRDRERLADAARRTARSPLGSGALSGTPYPVDRAALAADLGLEAVTENSLDAVSDRDFVAETLFAFALLGVHLSQLAEDLILYSSDPFGLLALPEAFTTGSSLMPQKQNPDLFELARAKSGRLLGDLTALLTVLKGLPRAYNKDLQEDKEPFFDAADTLDRLLPPLAACLEGLRPRPEGVQRALDPATLATELADYLVRKGVPFRKAHGRVGKAVRAALERGVSLAELPLDVYRSIDPAFGPDLYEVLDPERAVEARRETGGTAREALEAQLAAAEAALKAPEPPVWDRVTHLWVGPEG